MVRLHRHPADAEVPVVAACGGGVPSSAALTASIGSRSGGVSSRTGGMTAVSRSSGGTAVPPRAWRVGFAGRACAHTVSRSSRADFTG